MKRNILFLLLVFITGQLFGADYTKIDHHSESVPQNLRNANDIARYLTKNLTSPTDKARAIYYWIAHNIRYDVANMNSNLTYTNPQELVDQVLKTRKGVCSNYAALFQACCQTAGVQSYVIEGYTRQNGKTLYFGHAWNAVKINGRFYNIDCTWASGYFKGNVYRQSFTDDYFMIPSVEFIKTHMPFDPVWQFLNNPMTHKEFDTGDFSNLKQESDFNFSDSIKTLSGLDLSGKLTGENRRITKSGLTNNLIRNKVLQNEVGITTLKYNKATEAFNTGVEKYNEYIRCKNKQFNNLTMKDEDVLELLSASHQLVESAEETLSTTIMENHNLNQLITGLERSIHGMKMNLDREDTFMDKYINTNKHARLLLFYKKN
jgi:hypothetical protein